MYGSDRTSGRNKRRPSVSGSSRGASGSRGSRGSNQRRGSGSGRSGGSNRNRQGRGDQRSGSNRGRSGSGQRRPTVVQGGRQQRGSQQGRRPNGSRPLNAGRQQTPQGLVLPIQITAILALVAFVLACIITHAIMKPGVTSAQQDAKDAQAKVQELQQEVDRLNEEARAASANAASGVESKWTKTGKFSSGDATLDKEVKEFCDKHSNKDQKAEEAALAVYTWLSTADESEYVERDDAQNPAGPDWRIQYARQYFEHNNSGNCYEFACANMYILRYFGFDDAMAQKVIIEKESGDWGEHGLCFVTNTDGSKCLLDTSFGVNGWMVDQSKYNYQIQDVTKDTPTSSPMSSDNGTTGGTDANKADTTGTTNNTGTGGTTGTTDTNATTQTGTGATTGTTDTTGTTNNGGAATTTTNATTTNAGAAGGATTNGASTTTTQTQAQTTGTTSAVSAAAGNSSSDSVTSSTEGGNYVHAKKSEAATSKR